MHATNARSKTKIIVTLGPKLESAEALHKAWELGARIFRYNTSHGQEAQLEKFHEWVKLLQKKDPMVQLFLDLPGPKIRTGELGEGLEWVAGKSYRLGTEIPVNQPFVLDSLEKGQEIFFDDGKLSAICQEREGQEIWIKAQNHGLLKSRKGITIPLSSLAPEYRWTSQDEFWLQKGLSLGLKHFAISFVEEAEDLRKVRAKAPSLFLIAKIERPQAIRHFESILEEADAIMVARGDLGLEIPDYEVPAFQKEAIYKSRLHEKPVIIATQMLDSMTKNARATRAEISDVAHACFDLADAVMLSNESATGDYPFEAIQSMHNTLLASENFLFRYKKAYPLEALSPEKDYPKELEQLQILSAQNSFTLSKESPNLSLIKHRPAGKLIFQGEGYEAFAFHWGLSL